MQELWKLVKSPRHLLVFEAAARLGSFTLAAHELNVQQPAVSASIKQLEASLNVMLFERMHRRVTLTSAGQRLFIDVSKTLDGLLGSVQTVVELGRQEHVTLNASSAFNQYWMMPRLAELHSEHQAIDLRLQISDREPNIDAENIDLAIRRGDGDWPGCHTALIAAEAIFPVASPLVMRSAVNLKTVANLVNERLIHLEEPIRERPTWKQWFVHFGIQSADLNSGLRLNDYAMVLQAAVAGEGFAFGWQHVTKTLIDQGLLVARTEWTWKTGRGFYLVWSKNKPLSESAEKVRDWIVSKADRLSGRL